MIVDFKDGFIVYYYASIPPKENERFIVTVNYHCNLIWNKYELVFF